MYTQALHRPACAAAASSAIVPARRSLFLRLLDLFVRQDGQARARHHLAQLEPHLLRDVGLTAAEAETLAKAPEWDAPTHWKR